MTDGADSGADRDAIVGGATAAIVMALFGFLWALGSASALAGALVPVLVASSAVTAIMVAVGLRVLRAAGSFPRHTAASPDKARQQRRFRLVGIAEAVGIGIAVLGCAGLGRPELTPAAVAFVVGLHFLPLAAIFRAPLYYATGAALCAVAVATPIAAASSGVEASAWRVVPSLGAAAILWATSALVAVGGLGLIRRGA